MSNPLLSRLSLHFLVYKPIAAVRELNDNIKWIPVFDAALHFVQTFSWARATHAHAAIVLQ